MLVRLEAEERVRQDTMQRQRQQEQEAARAAAAAEAAAAAASAAAAAAEAKEKRDSHAEEVKRRKEVEEAARVLRQNQQKEKEEEKARQKEREEKEREKGRHSQVGGENSDPYHRGHLDDGAAGTSEEERGSADQKHAPVAPWSGSTSVTPQKSLTEIQKEEERRQRALKEARMAASGGKGGGMSWARATTTQAAHARPKSLAEIQEEEASAAAYASNPAVSAADKRVVSPAIARSTSTSTNGSTGNDSDGAPPPPSGPIHVQLPVSQGKLSQREKKLLLAEQQAEAVRQQHLLLQQQQQPGGAWNRNRDASAKGGGGGGTGLLTAIQSQEEERKKDEGQAAREAVARRGEGGGGDKAKMEQRLKMMLGLGAGGGGIGGGEAPAWQAKGKPVKSLLEIQEEEARRAAQEPHQAKGWAARAGVNAPPQRTSAPLAGASLGQVNGRRPGWVVPARPPSHERGSAGAHAASHEDFWGPKAEEKANAQRAPARPVQAPVPAPAPPPSRTDDSFGSAMPSELAAWCGSELRRIANNDDLTLMSFLYTVESPAETRQYLSQYLGSKPEVVNFASEFIKRRAVSLNGEGGGKKGKRK